jgi:hypothetical protein
VSDPSAGWLADCEALRALTQRYSRAIDERDHDVLAQLFHPDGSVDGVRGSSTVSDYLAQLRATEPSGPSMHVLGEPLIDLAPGADEGTLDTYAVVHQIPAAADGVHRMLGIRYVDRVVRHDGRWVLFHRQARMLWARELT